MWQHDDLEVVPAARQPVDTSDRVLELRDSEELRRREGTNRDDQTRAQQSNLAVEVAGTVRDLGGVRHAVSARLWIPAGKAADHGPDVDSFAEVLFRDSGVLGKPAEETPARGERERPVLDGLSWTGRLADQHHLSVLHETGHRRTDDVRAGAARQDSFNVGGKVQRHGGRSSATIAPTMRRLGFVLLLLFPLTATAWTRVSDERIAKKAASLAPPDLRMLIEKFESDYKAGLIRAQGDEGSDAHHYFVLSRQGRLREAIERETQGAIQMVRRGDPLHDVVERLGGLAHLVADANNPFHVANDAPHHSVAHNDFETYFERRLPKFPTVFYGLERDFRLSSFLDKAFTRSAKFYPLLRDEYVRGGRIRTSAEFDDRSTAFGVASVSYSRAVTDLVNLYYYIWKEAGGDVRSAAVMRDGNLMLNGKR